MLSARKIAVGLMVLTVFIYASCLQREHTHPYDPLTTPEDAEEPSEEETAGPTLTPTETATPTVTNTKCPAYSDPGMIDEFECSGRNIYGANPSEGREDCELIMNWDVVNTTSGSGGEVWKMYGVFDDPGWMVWWNGTIEFTTSTAETTNPISIWTYNYIGFKVRTMLTLPTVNVMLVMQTDDGDKYEAYFQGQITSTWSTLEFDHAAELIPKADQGEYHNQIHETVTTDEPTGSYFKNVQFWFGYSGEPTDFDLRIDDFRFYN